MSDPMVARLHAWLSEREPQMLSSLQDMLRIPSLEDTAAPNAPFGLENRRALDLALGWAKDAGMTTKDLDGFIGYGDFGQGKNLVAIFGHLDVVPVGGGWKHEPFGAEIDNGYLYSRGAVDDKGPTVAAFFAACAVKECFPELNSRVRIAFGCNEESGFACIHKYAEEEEAPTYGFAPDAGWPLYHAEKGIASLTVSKELIQGEMALLDLKGGQRPNIVIDHCTGSVRVAPTARKEIEEKLADSWDKNLNFHWEGDVLHFEAFGKAAHGAWPHGGDSAAVRAMRFLMEIAPVSMKTKYTTLFETTHNAGMGLGILGADDITELTSNVGVIWCEGGKLMQQYSVRYPVTWQGSRVENACRKFLAELKDGYELAVFNDSKPLYFPLDHPLVGTIIDVYEAETGERLKAGVMGGGTYARAVPNTVAIGTGWDGDGEAHQTDERLKVDHLYKMARIYAHLIYKLCSLD
ncbi:MAG: Sapep family Mn(2+)-dependent dipeptidase [Armatimonadetes bacterium]|nr:Sapep family Mn(2+)-dependent dipeptidase [Armatimonadota bacterium]